MEVIIKAVDDIKEPAQAHEFLDKFNPKVSFEKNLEILNF